MKLSDIGEFGLIERLTKSIAATSTSKLVVGPGDDAAAWQVGDRYVIATTDTMVDGVHFRSSDGCWGDVGWKALASNVSDIAAMGGVPKQALVTVCLPPVLDVSAVDELYAGLLECALEFGVSVAGGDVVRSPVVTITVAVMAEAVVVDGQPALLRRSGARAGDVVAVTGSLGDSAGGLRRLADGARNDPLVRRHLRPAPRVDAGQTAVRAGVRCGIDVSDGLLQDLGHVCDASGVGMVIRSEDVPVSDELRAAFPEDALEMALTGGEDYELILVGPRDALDGLPVTVIGEVAEETGVRMVDLSGAEITVERKGWDAFKG
jgi:thiamine-monophosphate kinase